MALIRIKQSISAISRGRFTIALALSFVLISHATDADEETRSRPLTSLSMGFRFTESTGEELFASACQGCHMPDGKGAVGAGAYPSLAQNSNLESGGYPVYVVVRACHRGRFLLFTGDAIGAECASDGRDQQPGEWLDANACNDHDPGKCQ